MLKAADKRRLLIAAGFGPPSVFPEDRFSRYWFVPRAFCPELATTGLGASATGKMLSFDEAWQRYEAKEGTCT